MELRGNISKEKGRKGGVVIDLILNRKVCANGRVMAIQMSETWIGGWKGDMLDERVWKQIDIHYEIQWKSCVLPIEMELPLK